MPLLLTERARGTPPIWERAGRLGCSPARAYAALVSYTAVSESPTAASLPS